MLPPTPLTTNPRFTSPSSPLLPPAHRVCGLQQLLVLVSLLVRALDRLRPVPTRVVAVVAQAQAQAQGVIPIITPALRRTGSRLLRQRHVFGTEILQGQVSLVEAVAARERRRRLAASMRSDPAAPPCAAGQFLPRYLTLHLVVVALTLLLTSARNKRRRKCPWHLGRGAWEVALQAAADTVGLVTQVTTLRTLVVVLSEQPVGRVARGKPRRDRVPLPTSPHPPRVARLQHARREQVQVPVGRVRVQAVVVPR